MNVNQKRRDLRVHAPHLTDGINVVPETEFFRGTLDFEFEKFVAQLRRGIE